VHSYLGIIHGSKPVTEKRTREASERGRINKWVLDSGPLKLKKSQLTAIFYRHINLKDLNAFYKIFRSAK
jgi:hypothetical protein